MKYSLILVLVLLVSCGKNQGSADSGGKKQQRQERGFIDLSAVDSAMPDLLNVTLDMPADVTTDRIVFLKNGSKTDQGKKFSCSLNVKEGEIWHYSVSGDNLSLEMANGTRLNMTRQSSSVWIATGTQNQLKMIYRFSLFNDRIILNQDCEG